MADPRISDSAFETDADTAPAPIDDRNDSSSFLVSHFGNPERDEVYGVGNNDYESEKDQAEDTRASANQAIWIIGAVLILVAVGYWIVR